MRDAGPTYALVWLHFVDAKAHVDGVTVFDEMQLGLASNRIGNFGHGVPPRPISGLAGEGLVSFGRGGIDSNFIFEGAHGAFPFNPELVTSKLSQDLFEIAEAADPTLFVATED